jgi:hypothetical protein
MNQVAADWNSTAFTNIVVTSNSYCPDDAPEIVLGRHFYGSNVGCDCLGIFNYDITGDDTMIVGEVCTYNQTRYGCDQCWPLTPIRQAQLNNLRVCGATGGLPFVNTTRPSEDTDGTYFCPSGTEACSSFTNSSNTVCVELGTTASNCPITDLQIVTTSELVNFNFDSLVTI